MISEEIIPGIILAGMGLLFFFNNKNMAKGASKFYEMLSKEKNLKVMFKVTGVILMFGGLIIIFTK
ncbi:hypothetical protein ACFL6I_11415 [candidate division KSB1 bacterium]